MTKHSPGPWRWDPNDLAIVSDDGEGAAVAFMNDHKSVRTVYATGEIFSHADARLIAKAPELLEALKRIDSAFVGPDWRMDVEALNRARALIREIEGTE